MLKNLERVDREKLQHTNVGRRHCENEHSYTAATNKKELEVYSEGFKKAIKIKMHLTGWVLVCV